jgi:hypothetical protein
MGEGNRVRVRVRGRVRSSEREIDLGERNNRELRSSVGWVVKFLRAETTQTELLGPTEPIPFRTLIPGGRDKQ